MDLLLQDIGFRGLTVTMIAEAGCSVIVREPAIPELPLIIGGYSGSDKNNVETVEFQEWCKTEIDMALKVSSTVVVVWGGGGWEGRWDKE